jgi:hypothetical protein
VYLIYTPDGANEPKRFKYQPQKLLSAEREMLERRTGLDFAEFTQKVLKGNGACRRALLFMYLKREHPTLRYEDVDFAWDQLTLEFSRSEYLQMREEISKTLTGDDLAIALEQIDAEIATAYDDTEGSGKAELPIVGYAAHLLHIRPWEWSLLTVEETDHVLEWLDAYKKDLDEANARARRGR